MLRFFNRVRFLFQFHKSIPFLKDFFFSNEVKTSLKVLFVALILGYFILPIDIIPDFLAVIGIVDDATIALFILQLMVKAAPDSLKTKHELDLKNSRQ